MRHTYKYSVRDACIKLASLEGDETFYMDIPDPQSNIQQREIFRLRVNTLLERRRT